MKQTVLLLACAMSVLSCNKTATGYNSYTQLLLSLPGVLPSNVTSVTDTTAISGGDVVSTGNSTVTARGICWSTSPNPTIANDTTWNGGGIGIFASRLTSLLSQTTYYVRAYAINDLGTAYGKEVSFTTASPPPPLPPELGYYVGQCHITEGSIFTPVGNVHNTVSVASSYYFNITMQLNGIDPPSGSIDNYRIVAASFESSNLSVTAFRTETNIVVRPGVTELANTALILNGNLEDGAWSGTITVQQTFRQGSRAFVNNASGYFSCQKK